MTAKVTQTIAAAVAEAQAAIDQAIARELAARPDLTGTAFDQAGLKDGRQIVSDYLAAGELGVALDHLRYMIEETGIALSPPTKMALAEVCRGLKVPNVNAGRRKSTHTLSD